MLPRPAPERPFVGLDIEEFSGERKARSQRVKR